MRKFAFIIFIGLMAVSLAGCSSCGEKKKPPAPEVKGFETGFASVETLVEAYIEAIVKKDPQILKRLFLTPDDLGQIKKGPIRQIWQAYFMICKRAFMDKNRDFLGQDLELVEFRLGRQIGEPGSQINVYRGSVAKLKLPDDRVIINEINFIIEAAGTWKIFGLKYIQEEMKRRGMLDDMGIFEGEAKFKGVDSVRDVNIKVKKIQGNEEAPSSPAGPEEPASSE